MKVAASLLSRNRIPLEGNADDTRKTCDQQTFGHRPINICGATLCVDFCKRRCPHSARWSLSLVTVTIFSDQ